MLSFILGYTSDEFTDVAILGFLSTLNLGQSPSILFNFARFIAESMHYQLSRLSEEGVFRYSSYLFHLFLYYQTDKFPIECQKVDAEGKVLSIVFWSSILENGTESIVLHISMIHLYLLLCIFWKKRRSLGSMMRQE